MPRLVSEARELAADVVPFSPNWESGVVERHIYKTTINSSRKGYERRFANGRNPRVTFEMRADRTEDAGEQFRAVRPTEARNKLPCPIRKVATSTPPVAAAPMVTTSTITVSLVPDWAAVGVEIVVSSSAAVEATTIRGVTGFTLTVDALSYDHEDPCYVHLAHTIVQPDSAQFRRSVNLHVQQVQTFRVQPGVSDVADLSQSFYSYQAYPVFPFRHNWRSGYEEELDYGIAYVDTEVGRIAAVDAGRQNMVTFGMDLVLREAQARQMQDFFYLTSGRRGCFWMPHTPLYARATGSSGGSTLSFNSNSFLDLLDDLELYSAVFVFWPDGAYQVIQISSVAAGPPSVLNLKTALARDVDTSCRVELGGLCRFGTDTLELNWSTTGVASIRTSVVGVRDFFIDEALETETVTIPINRLDPLILWTNPTNQEVTIDLVQNGVTYAALADGAVNVSVDAQGVGLFVSGGGIGWRSALCRTMAGFFDENWNYLGEVFSYKTLSTTGANTDMSFTGVVDPNTRYVKFRWYIAFTPFYSDVVYYDTNAAVITFPRRGYYAGVSDTLKWL